VPGVYHDPARYRRSQPRGLDDPPPSA
jgi:hypothetical protein